MENVSDSVKFESIQSFQSTIRKSENALDQMAEKGANTALIRKRLKAFRIGLSMLKNTWYQEPHPYTQEELAEARHVLKGLLPSIKRIYAESKEGSPQKNLLERRIKAFQLAVQAIDDFAKQQEEQAGR